MLILPGLALALVMNSGTVLARERRVDHHDECDAPDAGNWRHIFDEIELEIVVERRVVGVRVSGNEQSVAIRRRMRDGLGCDVATCARPVFNEELLAHPLRKRITISLAVVSVKPPGGKPAMMRTDRDG